MPNSDQQPKSQPTPTDADALWERAKESARLDFEMFRAPPPTPQRQSLLTGHRRLS